MRTFTTLIEESKSYDLEYRLKNHGTMHNLYKSKEDALMYLKSQRDINYAYLFKPGTMNSSELEGLVFWYSDDNDNNFWNNTYKSTGLKDSVRKELEKKRIVDLNDEC